MDFYRIYLENLELKKQLAQEKRKNSANYYSIIPATVRYDKSLKANEKLLYSEITALSSKEGYCWSTNKYFAELYNVSDRTIRDWVSNLREKGFIKVEMIYKKDSKEIEQRNLTPLIKLDDLHEYEEREETDINETPTFYSVLPAQVRYDKELTAFEKLLYSEITALCNKKGYCWSVNSYFAKNYKIQELTIVRSINNLKDKKYIEIIYNKIKGSPDYSKRIIKLIDINKRKNPEDGNKKNKNINTPLKENFSPPMEVKDRGGDFCIPPPEKNDTPPEEKNDTHNNINNNIINRSSNKVNKGSLVEEENQKLKPTSCSLNFDLKIFKNLSDEERFNFIKKFLEDKKVLNRFDDVDKSIKKFISYYSMKDFKEDEKEIDLKAKLRSWVLNERKMGQNEQKENFNNVIVLTPTNASKTFVESFKHNERIRLIFEELKKYGVEENVENKRKIENFDWLQFFSGYKKNEKYINLTQEALDYLRENKKDNFDINEMKFKNCLSVEEKINCLRYFLVNKNLCGDIQKANDIAYKLILEYKNNLKISQIDEKFLWKYSVTS